MRNWIDLDALPYAAGAILLGIITLAVGDFALQWQPVPTGMPAYHSLVPVSAGILILGGLFALWRNGGWARLILPAFYAVWVLALHLPNFAKAPNVGSLLGVAESLSLAAAGIALAPSSRPESARKIARMAYGLCAIEFGLSHLAYADFTSTMVPAWLPARLFWAYFTGAAHIAAGLAIASGLFSRLAATMLALMMASFVLLVHIPGVAAAPNDRLQWTMLAMALTLAGGAWLVRRLAKRQPQPSIAPALAPA
jgi:uncharacterized membrane protein YphA (DoxX/SURF4 family)